MKKIILTLTPEELNIINQAAPRVYLEALLTKRFPGLSITLNPASREEYEIQKIPSSGWPQLPALFRRNGVQDKFQLTEQKRLLGIWAISRLRNINFLTVAVTANLILVPLLFWIFINYA